MKRSLTFLFTLSLFFSSGLKAMAMFSHSTAEQVQSLTIVQGSDCKGDDDDKCK